MDDYAVSKDARRSLRVACAAVIHRENVDVLNGIKVVSFSNSVGIFKGCARQGRNFTSELQNACESVGTAGLVLIPIDSGSPARPVETRQREGGAKLEALDSRTCEGDRAELVLQEPPGPIVGDDGHHWRCFAACRFPDAAGSGVDGDPRIAFDL